MINDPSNSILSDPATTFEAGSSEVKERIDSLAADDTPEATDEMLNIAKDHGVSVTPNMSAEEIREKVHEVL